MVARCSRIWGEVNKKQARANLLNAVRLVVDGLEMIGIPPLKGRDKREPGRKEKEAYEDKLRSAIVRHFGRQRKKVRAQLENDYPNRKALDYSGLDATDEDTIAELMLLLQDATRHGINLFGQRSKIQIDWTLVNKRAAQWAREYVYDLVKDIDKTTQLLLQDAISQFVETPGMNLSDVMDLLPFDEERAQRIAVTEITRVYAKADQVAGEELKKEFPDVRVVKIFFTNNDELVCEACSPLNGKEVEIDENFYEPQNEYQDGNPPLHPSCRCWTESTTKLED
jgi:hypothetical protein